MEITLFDLMTEEEQELYKPIKSNEWDWKFSDYPEKNGIKVFSCFACGGVRQWVINWPAARL